ncbi:unnamed protein product [Prorocentrum cordatum]|uniref:Protein YIPF3 n=1 Tax=Prorocentrum cordatum TaxID=2364126 RepID=A0ABN9T6U1_9DINO|nr:unnamed protein product [Polarella glacialis]
MRAARGRGMDFYSPPAGNISAPFGAPQPPQPLGGAPMAPGPAPMGGSIGGPMQPGGVQPGIFSPGPAPQPAAYDEGDIENEPPLLEELGINVEHILARIKGVAFFKKVDQEVLSDLDLSGPLAIIMALACCLLLAGKISFSYLYGMGFSGSSRAPRESGCW